MMAYEIHKLGHPLKLRESNQHVCQLCTMGGQRSNCGQKVKMCKDFLKIPRNRMGFVQWGILHTVVNLTLLTLY